MLLLRNEKPKGGVQRYSTNGFTALGDIGRSRCGGYETHNENVSIIRCGPSEKRRRGGGSIAERSGATNTSPQAASLSSIKKVFAQPTVHPAILCGADFKLPDPLLKTHAPVMLPYKLPKKQKQRLVTRQANIVDDMGLDYQGIPIHIEMYKHSPVLKSFKRKRETIDTVEEIRHNELTEVTDMSIEDFKNSVAGRCLRRRFRDSGCIPPTPLSKLLPQHILDSLIFTNNIKNEELPYTSAQLQESSYSPSFCSIHHHSDSINTLCLSTKPLYSPILTNSDRRLQDTGTNKRRKILLRQKLRYTDRPTLAS